MPNKLYNHQYRSKKDLTQLTILRIQCSSWLECLVY